MAAKLKQLWRENKILRQGREILPGIVQSPVDSYLKPAHVPGAATPADEMIGPIAGMLIRRGQYSLLVLQELRSQPTYQQCAYRAGAKPLDLLREGYCWRMGWSD